MALNKRGLRAGFVLGITFTLAITACGSGDDPEGPQVPDVQATTQPSPDPESEGASGDGRAVPVFPEDDIDWDSLRYKVPDSDDDTWAGYEVYTPNYSLEQWQALDEEGKVSREDYEAAFLRFQACTEEHGATLNSVVMTGEEINTSHSDADDDIVMACYERHFMLVDGAWQVNLPPKDITWQIYAEMDCLEHHGFEPVIGRDEITTELGVPQEDQLWILMEQTFESGIECHEW